MLFVKNLPYDLTKEELRDAFDGSLEARIALHPDTQKSKGFVHMYVIRNSSLPSNIILHGTRGTDGRSIYLHNSP